MTNSQSTLDKIFKNNDGQIVLMQKPNILLLTWLASMVMRRLITQGTLHEIFSSLAFGSLFAWAYLEMTQGVNYFRRGLGMVVLLTLLLNGTS